MEALCRGVNVIIKDYLPARTRMYYWCLRLRGQINTRGTSAPSTKANLENMGEFFDKHLSKIIDWIEGRKYIDVLYIDYSDFLINPDEHIKKLNRFLDYRLNEEKALHPIK